jgi:hypothetical protein
MTSEERGWFSQWRKREITLEEVISRFGTDDGVALGLRLLSEAIEAERSEDIECSLSLCWGFGFVSEHLPLLVKLTRLDCHINHEDVIRALDFELKFRTPEACDVFYDAVFFVPEYLEWDENRALARKALFGLGNIHSELSEARIREISVCDDEVLRDLAWEQIDRHQIP